MEIKAQTIEIPNGKLVVLPEEEYNRLVEAFEDLQDILLIREAKNAPENQKKGVTPEELLEEFGA